ncbi:MAG: hypothetical protein EHM68_15690 [Lysobacterales bacterium]|nr:MAG: hypothetical protein EHM68_15690 [Xanthomonadales bacterium]
MLYRKRIVILLLLIAALLANFWLGSRYPAIDEKAAMAGEAVLEDVLSFEATLRAGPDDPFWERVGKSTVNWTLTNRQGMTFGVLLASLVLTLLQFWPLRPSAGHSVRDILKGILIGTPLGVCVNCAAPIAYGMNRQGVQHGTSLATMFASPSLNVIVVTMMFSLLPLYMAVTKVALTFLFLLLVLPLLLRIGLPREAAATAGDAAASCAKTPRLRAAEGWLEAGAGLVKPLLRNFLFIVLRTVPLMLLAGLLGAALANLLPLESFAGWRAGFGAMALVALLGTFAPVPIAFDIVVIQALLVAGLPPQFALILLITLGMFSIYPFLIVSRMLSLRFALLLFGAVALLGLGAGYFAQAFEAWQRAQNQQTFVQQFAGREAAEIAAPSAAAPPAPAAGADATPEEMGFAPAAGETVYAAGALRIESTPFRPRSAARAPHFERHSGHSWGLVSAAPQLLDLMLPFSQGRGIASGDFDGDGWPDLAVANNTGVNLFRNIGGERFEPAPVAGPRPEGVNSLLVAFVDIDDDGCLDLFSGGFGERDWFLLNGCSGFAAARWVEVPKGEGLMTQAASFGDPDRDGDLDLLIGNWFFLIPRVATSPRNVNYMVENHGIETPGGLRLEPRALDEIHGATLSVLLSDFDGDGLTDRIIGNDYQEPDIFYRGLGGGEFEMLQAGGSVPISPLATMSIDSADIDNDLDLDLFLSGKINDFSMVRHREGSLQERRRFVIQRRQAFEREYCQLFENGDDRERCRAEFVNHDLIRGTRLAPCRRLPTTAQQDECMVTLQIKNALIARDWSFCAEIPAETFPVHHEVCRAYAEFDATAQPHVPGYQYLDRGAIPQSDQGNVLLVRQDDGRFVEQSEELGVFDGHWAWNARFADLDHDEWQDLYLVNGWWLETSMYSNDFFHNRQGQGFDSRAEEFGLDSLLKQHAFTLFDLDLDGDLDIVTRSLAGDLQVYVNGLQDGHSIVFEFRDATGNFFGIGNRVTIAYGENGERHQVRELKSGGGFVSFDAPQAHFGLGRFDRVSRVVVDWWDGTRSEIAQEFTAGRRYTVSRGPSGDIDPMP